MSRVQTATELDGFYAQADPWGYRTHPDDQRRRAELLGALPRRRYERVLDIGCGNGFVTLSLPGESVTGVDLSTEAIRWARSAAGEAPDAARYRFEAMSLFDPALASLGRFDLIIVTGVLYPQYLGGALAVAREALDSRLDEGGILVCCHIRQWGIVRMPYVRLDATLYPYRDYVHELEVYRK